MSTSFRHRTPRTIIQFWHDLRELPKDINDCISSWTRLTTSGFKHRLFDEGSARAFIADSLGERHERAYERCYHPAMQADYFRLCYLFVEGGFYVDADDVCLDANIAWLFDDGRLKIQPLCYDTVSARMVDPSVFLPPDAYNPGWIFYFNNNPLIANEGHPIIERALRQATELLECTVQGALPEIQATTGPGNLSRSILEHFTMVGGTDLGLVILREWDSLAVSKWPLSHRGDARNWRLSNQQRFNRSKDSSE
jgi:mannosyltransferase OCH1-like enzyme